MNFYLKPLPIAITDCALVDKDWHARFSALERKYLFRLLVRRAPSAHEAGFVWQIGHSLDLSKMIEASECLVGKHDFTTFRSAHCQAESPVKTKMDLLEMDCLFLINLFLILKVIFGLDNWKPAIETHDLNHPDFSFNKLSKNNAVASRPS